MSNICRYQLTNCRALLLFRVLCHYKLNAFVFCPAAVKSLLYFYIIFLNNTKALTFHSSFWWSNKYTLMLQLNSQLNSVLFSYSNVSFIWCFGLICEFLAQWDVLCNLWGQTGCAIKSTNPLTFVCLFQSTPRASEMGRVTSSKRLSARGSWTL